MLDVLESGRSEVPLTVACIHDSTVVLTKTDNSLIKKQHVCVKNNIIYTI